MPRPPELPEFEAPPINELVMGVQFNPVRGYSLIRAGEVWDLFKSEYPVVQEQGELPPRFETYGGGVEPFAVGFNILNSPPHPRFWFLAPGGDQLLQFQTDRFLHNWRQIDGLGGEYPRFENLFDRFRSETQRLAQYMEALEADTFTVNQVEISYVNRIYAGDRRTLPNAGDYFRFINFGQVDTESFGGNFRRVAVSADGKPKARFYCDVASAQDANGAAMIVLTLTYRGAPTATSPSGALELIEDGRNFIVQTFADITTEAAHNKWRRTH
jgi:uncharacterized protein (TIGR04255 family)